MAELPTQSNDLMQDMQSLLAIGSDIPIRLVLDRINLYIGEIIPMISKYRAEVLDFQTQYADSLEDFVKAVFVHGVEDAIAARDAWHLEKVNLSFLLDNAFLFDMAIMPQDVHLTVAFVSSLRS